VYSFVKWQEVQTVTHVLEGVLSGLLVFSQAAEGEQEAGST